MKEIVRPLLEKRWSEEMKERVYNMLHERDYNGKSTRRQKLVESSQVSLSLSTRKSLFISQRSCFDRTLEKQGVFPPIKIEKETGMECAFKAEVCCQFTSVGQ